MRLLHRLACLRPIADLQPKIDFFADLLLQDVGRFIRRAVVFDQRFPDFFWARANQFQLALQKKTQTIDGIDV